VAWLLLCVILLAASTTVLADALRAPISMEKTPTPIPASDSSKIQIAQAWIRELFGTGMLPVPDRVRPERERHDEDERQGPQERPAVNSGTYRTVCVRLCDGFYFPVSFSTYRSHFTKDAQLCEQRCPSGARLFVHPTGVRDERAHMTDLQGNPYSEIPNAFRSQKEYVPNCTCNGNPWDQAELTRHKAYADAAKYAARDGGKRKTARVVQQRSGARKDAVAARRPMGDEN
jgi:hypothetical protein